MSSNPTTTNGGTNAAGQPLPPLPADHLDHPEQWATGGEPATAKQKGYIKVLEGQHPDAVPEGGVDVEGLGKSEASEVIDKLRNGRAVGDKAEEAEAQAEGEGKVGDKRKSRAKEKDADSGKKKEEGDDVAKADEDGADVDVNVDVENDDKKASREVVEMEQGQTTLDKSFKTSTTTASSPSTTKTSTKPKPEFDEKDDDNDDEKRQSKKPRLAKDHQDESTDVIEDVEEPSSDLDPANGSGRTAAAPVAEQTEDDTVPGDSEHLDHPENWTTGDEPATEKQKGYIKVLEKQKGRTAHVPVEGLGKSEASEKIDELRSG